MRTALFSTSHVDTIPIRVPSRLATPANCSNRCFTSPSLSPFYHPIGSLCEVPASSPAIPCPNVGKLHSNPNRIERVCMHQQSPLSRPLWPEKGRQVQMRRPRSTPMQSPRPAWPNERDPSVPIWPSRSKSAPQVMLVSDNRPDRSPIERCVPPSSHASHD